MNFARRIKQKLGVLGVLVVAGLGGLGVEGCGDDTDTTDGGGGSGGSGGSTPGSLEPSPGGVRRLTSSQLRYSVEYMMGADAALAFDVWTDPQLHGFESIGAAELSLAANDITTLDIASRAAIQAALTDVSSLARIVPCVQSTPDTACYGEVAAQLGRVAWRRPLTEDEKQRLTAIGSEGQTFGAGDFDTGLLYELMAILQSPNFIYMSEIGEESGEHRTLTSLELASRLSFFLLHRTPDTELLDAAESGGLDDNEGQLEQAQRMLALPEARRAMDRFFSELYLIRDIASLSKEAELYPNWNEQLARSMQEEMLRFLDDIVWTHDGDAREIFSSRSTFVDATLAGFYGVTPPSAGWAKVELPEDQGRAGLLGKAGFLARFAHPVRTSPTRRGRFVREKLLCKEIPPPPGNVDVTLPEPTPENWKTMRERLAEHSNNPNCSGCHSLMDPIGLAYEHFDATGQYRPDDNGSEIVTQGKSGDLEFEGPEDIGAFLEENGSACLVRNFWRQSMGHMETKGEEGMLRLVEQAFAEEGFSVQELMTAIAMSPAFKLVGDPK